MLSIFFVIAKFHWRFICKGARLVNEVFFASNMIHFQFFMKMGSPTPKENKRFRLNFVKLEIIVTTNNENSFQKLSLRSFVTKNYDLSLLTTFIFARKFGFGSLEEIA